MHLLFVCTGNTCRSPLAEAIAREVTRDRQLADMTVSSAGTSAIDGQPASDGAVLVGLEHHLDLTEHRARQLTREIIDAVDLVLVMGPHHLDRVEALGATGRAYLLTDYASRGAVRGAVSDPFGGGLDAYRAAVHELEDTVRRAIERLVTERAPKLS